MENPTPKKFPVGLAAGIAAAALAAALVGGYFGLCSWVQTNGRLLPGAVAVDDKGETVADTVRVIRCFADIIAMRHFKEGAPLVASQYAGVPVINAGDGSHSHPTQTLTDLLTIKREKGRLDHLTIGFCGSQPGIADWYTNNGSLYMASLAFMPLGLPADNAFWSSPAEEWTQKKAWGGEPFPKDHVWKDEIRTKDKY